MSVTSISKISNLRINYFEVKIGIKNLDLDLLFVMKKESACIYNSLILAVKNQSRQYSVAPLWIHNLWSYLHFSNVNDEIQLEALLSTPK